MRSFPRTVRRRLRLGAVTAVCALALGGLAVPVVVPSAARADQLKDKQKQVKKQIQATSDHLEESSARARRTVAALEQARVDLATARDALGVAKARVHAARIKDRLMQQRLDDAIARLAQARENVASGQQAVVDKQDDVAALVTSIYEYGDPQLVAIGALLNAQTAADLTRQAEVNSVMVGDQTRAYDELRAAEVLLKVRRDQVREAKQAAADRRQEAADHLAETEALKAQAQSAKQSYAASVVQRRDAAGAARKAKAADLRKLRQLKAEEDRIAAMLRKRAQQRKTHSAPTSASGGYLSYPANGRVTSGYGYRIHPIYGYWGLHDGTDFGAACGSPLYAAADGKVISAYWSSVYGNRMIVDFGVVKGVSLAAIYNHATRYTVSVGQRVSRGQVIGYVGSTGWSTGCHLHFTVMVNGHTVDPMGWL